MRDKNRRQTLLIEAPVKINLHLQIIGRRPDGYHDLDSLMLKLQLADQLRLTLRDNESLNLVCLGADLPEDETNLAFRAALVFLRENSISQGVDIELNKKVPVAAGLGGGSSDAAAVLLGLNELHQSHLPEEKMLAMARQLGADVSFFIINSVAARAEGVGDRLTPVTMQDDFRVLLVNPGFPVSTRWAYENFALTTADNPYILGRHLNNRGKVDIFALDDASRLANDLESVTIGRFPEIGMIKKELLADGAEIALMTGSGPTVFGLFLVPEKAARSQEQFQQRYGDNVFLTRPLLPKASRLSPPPQVGDYNAG